jgi:hypothetical protein
MNPLDMMGGGGLSTSSSASSASGDTTTTLQNELGLSSTFAVISGQGNKLSAASSSGGDGGGLSGYLPWIVAGAAGLLLVTVLITR